MGITVQLVALRSDVLDALRRSPSVLDLVLSCRGDVARLKEHAAQASSESRDDLLLCGADPDQLARFAADPALDDIDRCIRAEVDLGKTWDAIRFLLGGRADALGGSAPALAGTGYQVEPRVVDESRAGAVAQALRGITPEDLRARFDPDALVSAEVYPERLWHRDDALDELLERFSDLVWFYKRVAALGWAVLVCTTL